MLSEAALKMLLLQLEVAVLKTSRKHLLLLYRLSSYCCSTELHHVAMQQSWSLNRLSTGWIAETYVLTQLVYLLVTSIRESFYRATLILPS